MIEVGFEVDVGGYFINMELDYHNELPDTDVVTLQEIRVRK